jgi:hypothetical protein
LIENFGVFVSVPLRFLDMFFRHHGAARPMKTRAVDQAGLKSLKLLAGNDMIVNIDNHDKILSTVVGVLTIRERHATASRYSLATTPGE